MYLVVEGIIIFFTNFHICKVQHSDSGVCNRKKMMMNCGNSSIRKIENLEMIGLSGVYRLNYAIETVGITNQNFTIKK